MSKEATMIQIKAIYENGMLRPLQSVHLSESQEVTVTIDGTTGGDEQTLFVLPPERWQLLCDALDAPPRNIQALRKLLTEASVLDGNGADAARADST